MGGRIPATLIIVVFFSLAVPASAQTPPPTQTNLGCNDAFAPQFLVWCNGGGQTCVSVGWYFTPSVNFNPTAVQTNFNAVVQPGSQDREVTIEILSDRRFVGGTKTIAVFNIKRPSRNPRVSKGALR